MFINYNNEIINMNLVKKFYINDLGLCITFKFLNDELKHMWFDNEEERDKYYQIIYNKLIYIF